MEQLTNIHFQRLLRKPEAKILLKALPCQDVVARIVLEKEIAERPLAKELREKKLRTPPWIVEAVGGDLLLYEARRRAEDDAILGWRTPEGIKSHVGLAGLDIEYGIGYIEGIYIGDPVDYYLVYYDDGSMYDTD